MSECLVEFENSFLPELVTMKGILVRPGNGDGKSTLLIRKCIHLFLNGRLANTTQRFYAIFYDLYKDFKIPSQTIPFVILEVKA